MECWPVIHPMRSLPVWISHPPFLPQGGFMGMMGVGFEGGYKRSSSMPSLHYPGGTEAQERQGTLWGQDQEAVLLTTLQLWGLSGCPLESQAGSLRTLLSLSGPPFLLWNPGEPVCQNFHEHCQAGTSMTSFNPHSTVGRPRLREAQEPTLGSTRAFPTPVPEFLHRKVLAFHREHPGSSDPFLRGPGHFGALRLIQNLTGIRGPTFFYK